jgi:circadian clock protein KaiB
MPVKTSSASRATRAFEKALAAGPAGFYVLRLYVAGATGRSREAILRVRRLCEAEPKGSCELEVIDVYQRPILARDGQIVATPTLVRERPPPVRRFVGNLAHATGLFAPLDPDAKNRVGR